MEYSMTGCLATLLCIIVVFWFWKRRLERKSFPPGPRQWPILGSILSIPKSEETPLHCWAIQMAQKYGDIFSFRIGSSPQIVVINKYSLVKKALIDKGAVFASRPWYPYRMKYYNPKRIGIADGQYNDEWRAQRKTVMAILKTVGFGQNVIYDKIQQESLTLVKTIKNKNVESFDPLNMIQVIVANVICFILFAENYAHDDKEFREFLTIMEDFMLYFLKDVEGDYIPLLRYTSAHKETMKRFIKCSEVILKFIDNKIKKRREIRRNQAESGDTVDFVQGYLSEIDRAKQGKSRLTEDWIVNVVLDCLVAGMDTTATTLDWALLYMINYPEVQKNVQREIDEVFSSSGDFIDYALRNKTPYTEATILEICRFSAIAAFSLPHSTSESVEFEGFYLPKNTEVWFNLYQVAHDSELWGDPENFRPERFIDDEGTVKKPEHFTIFSIGRRSCMGEQLARQELYIFFVHLLRSFEFYVPEGTTPPTLKALPSDSLRHATRYKIQAKPRSRSQ